VLLYEIGFSSERMEPDEAGELVKTPASWEFAQDLFDKKIALIQDEVGATQSPLLFFTNTPRINKIRNKERKRNEETEKIYVDNFRNEVAKEKEYKGGRKADKPFHFYNLLNYALANYDVYVDESGLEADDSMCIMQYSAYKNGELNTTICSRDKDVRMCPGLHYSWECGRQASVGPILVDDLGYLQQGPKKVFGVGQKFFYYQLLVGDTVDNIGGIKGCGPVFAFKLLNNAKSIRQCYELVGEIYIKHYGDDWKTKFREQADLLWMVREISGEGEKIKWTPPKIIE